MSDQGSSSSGNRKKYVTVDDIINACWDDDDDESDFCDDISSDEHDGSVFDETDDDIIADFGCRSPAIVPNVGDPCERDTVLTFDVSRIPYYSTFYL